MQFLLNIDVPDIVQAEAFYREVFGLAVGRRFGDEGVELLGAQTAIYLLKKPDGSIGAGGARRDYSRHWMPVHVDIEVEDLQGSLARALAAGAVQEGQPREGTWGRIVQIADPFGHGWCLLQFLGRGYDEVAT